MSLKIGKLYRVHTVKPYWTTPLWDNISTKDMQNTQLNSGTMVLLLSEEVLGNCHFYKVLWKDQIGYLSAILGTLENVSCE